MYQLYCAPNTYAMGPHVLLEELGVAYEIIEVEILTSNPGAEFLAVSPHARVPALRHEHGTIFESGAIALHLADAHADKGWSVTPDHPLRAEYLQWLFYLSSTVQPEVLIQFHPEFYFAETGQREALKEASMQRLNEIWTVLDRAYSSGPYLLDERPTAADICVAIQTQWHESFDRGIEEFPNLERSLHEISSRSAFRKVMSWHHGPRI